MSKLRASRGFTIIELLVVVSIIALLIGILLPAIGKARDAALVTQSSANMRNMGAAHAAYSADWSDRQWTAVPDDAGLYNGSCTAYLQVACPPQQILGWDDTTIPTIWGYFLGSGGQCSQFGYPGSCGGWAYYTPNSFTPNSVVGAFRLINVKSFNTYLNGRYYDPVFFAPKDTLIVEGAQKYFTAAAEFTSQDGEIYNSSYCLSAAAMWAPDVLGRNPQTNKYYTNPNTLPSGFKSPASGQATYPDLKTRMTEHNWLQQKPGSDVNYNFSGGETPWFFNQGYNSSPVTLYYDGHVQIMSIAECMESDSRANAQSGVGLWSRDTPLGANGYYQAQSYDFLVDSSCHILTLDGIQGRDTIGTK
jgi:prepilin-type N-terminal cleavage/methylation domain-containing protein